MRFVQAWATVSNVGLSYVSLEIYNTTNTSTSVSVTFTGITGSQDESKRAKNLLTSGDLRGNFSDYDITINTIDEAQVFEEMLHAPLSAPPPPSAPPQDTVDTVLVVLSIVVGVLLSVCIAVVVAIVWIAPRKANYPVEYAPVSVSTRSAPLQQLKM